MHVTHDILVHPNSPWHVAYVRPAFECVGPPLISLQVIDMLIIQFESMVAFLNAACKDLE